MYHATDFNLFSQLIIEKKKILMHVKKCLEIPTNAIGRRGKEVWNILGSTYHQRYSLWFNIDIRRPD